ncbi:ester cyclase [uncultured Alteromonas sp.]|jgi:predicted SnoaL-like aldol condensation-catalyzing enzyme|uniref:nuclear transport factor 2 family protein n=1 Tax=uncultured Alteromonas sp. TaxID=179113 RepID=UPI0025D447E2|nr:ester cyclase [uncultured Alteromonas sp.]
MKSVFSAMLLSLMVFSMPTGAQEHRSTGAQEAVTAAEDHRLLLQSDDPQLAANKQLVYDFWREVFEGGHLELADKYLTESYIQHNPNVPSGRQSFVDFFSQFTTAKPIKETVEMPLVSIVAEKDWVILTFVQDVNEPEGKNSAYTTTWFDMFRIEDGKIAEHWDPARKMP